MGGAGIAGSMAAAGDVTTDAGLLVSKFVGSVRCRYGPLMGSMLTSLHAPAWMTADTLPLPAPRVIRLFARNGRDCMVPAVFFRGVRREPDRPK
jgi:hypothetical protein